MEETPSAAAPAPAPTPASAPARPVLWTNLITLFGLLLVGVGLVLLFTFWLFRLLSRAGDDNQYLNIIGYLVLPGILVSGLIVCPLGMLVRKWRIKYFGPIKHISARAAVTFLGVTFFLILPVLGVSGYTGYHYTESTDFCGSCHAVMEPQYARYQQSPHARVTCAGCHIGPGASPFVKSKLSGVRQVFKTALQTYPRPIPPAITSLRPARDTCEQCHWPAQFFGSQLQTITRFAHDEQNTRRDYEIRLKVGGDNKHLGRAEGIHMHMLDRVEYVATDPALQHIPWVRYTYEDGRTVVYRSDGEPSGDPPPSGDVRKLDCIDCHNLSGHEFPSPQRAVDHALNIHQIDETLPYIKHMAVNVLDHEYPSVDAANAGIAQTLEEFYKTKYPEIWSTRRDAVNQAIEGVRHIYRDTIFPYMKVDWRTYPNNIGHMESLGCFRCHDGLHIAENGRAISSDCMSCHTFLMRQSPDGPITEGSFSHPMKIHDSWQGLGVHHRMLCSDCHDGGTKAVGEPIPETACGDCHSSGRWEKMREELNAREAASSRPAK